MLRTFFSSLSSGSSSVSFTCSEPRATVPAVAVVVGEGADGCGWVHGWMWPNRLREGE